MKPTFHHAMVNGPFDDPCLYVRLFWQRRALLFDAGDISALDHGSIMKITDVFVTHTHIDHFIGFDSILRAHLSNERPLSIYGPAEIIDHVEGKLGGYTWNVIEQYPIKLEVFGIGPGKMKHSSFHASNGFRRIDHDEKPFDGIVLEDEFFTVRAATLRHDIPCLAYSLEEDFHINIDKDALAQMGLPVGPWLADLKALIRKGAPEDSALYVQGQKHTLHSLSHLATITTGQKISYVMDTEPIEENVEKIIALVKESDTLYCEAYFMEADTDRALERHHLTARLTGRIAREGRVRKLVPAHFSPKYMGAEHTPGHEAIEEFQSRP